MKVFLVTLATVAVVLAAPSPDLNPRIVGGKDATRGQFPHQISLQVCILNRACQHACGGTIVGKTTVVTAAHCLPTGRLYQFKIVAGILNLNDTNAEKQTIDVEKFTVHPGYNRSSSSVQPHDLAILSLKSPLKYNSQVQPAKLPQQDFYPSGNGILSGWGSTAPDTRHPVTPNTLQTITIPVISDIKICYSELKKALPADFPLDLKGGNVCTEPGIGVSACVGDSGGPLINSNNVLIGVVSWGVTPCGKVGAPNVFVNMGGYMKWAAPLIPDLV